MKILAPLTDAEKKNKAMISVKIPLETKKWIVPVISAVKVMRNINLQEHAQLRSEVQKRTIPLKPTKKTACSLKQRNLVRIFRLSKWTEIQNQILNPKAQ